MPHHRQCSLLTLRFFTQSTAKWEGRKVGWDWSLIWVAYDRVEWPFLQPMMQRIGFGDRWINTIMDCVSTSNLSFIVDGGVVRNVKPQWGLRQGCPISLYLFLLCAQGLTASIRKVEERGKLQGIVMAKRAPWVSHLFFADDSIIFGRAKEDEAQIISHILHDYSRASGWQVNFLKSMIYFTPHVQEELKSEIQVLGLSDGGVSHDA